MILISRLKDCQRNILPLNLTYSNLINKLETNPIQGEPFGKDCSKIHLNIKSKKSGKSCDGRVITCVKIIKSVVYLLAIYDKSEKETLNDKELNELLKIIGLV
jgi:mRNA-degrading endonuclease RelE of RelBE toxin-antitoxin system